MATVYSTGIYSGPFAAGASLLYTVPSGKRLVVRDITAFMDPIGSGSPGSIAFYDLSTNGFIAAWVQPFVQSGRLYHWEGRQALDAAEELYCFVGTGAGDWYGRVFGYLLTLP
jgi:hypothetical protein